MFCSILVVRCWFLNQHYRVCYYTGVMPVDWTDVVGRAPYMGDVPFDCPTFRPRVQGAEQGQKFVPISQ